MTKGTINRASWTAFVLLALGCGGRAEGQTSASAAGSDSASGVPSVAIGGSPSVDVGDLAGSNSAAAGVPGVGPIDATGLPTQLPIECPGPTPPPLALPCKIGNLLAGANVLECYDLAGKTALQSFIPLGQLPAMLNQPVQFPFASLPPVPGSKILTLTGTVTFSQVDPVGRAFVARLTRGAVTWVGVNGETVGCPVSDTPFWAVKGDFT